MMHKYYEIRVDFKASYDVYDIWIQLIKLHKRMYLKSPFQKYSYILAVKENLPSNFYKIFLHDTKQFTSSVNWKVK